MAASFAAENISNDISVSVSVLERSLVSESTIQKLSSKCANVTELQSSEILSSIEGIVIKVLQDVSRGQAPSLSYSSTESWTDVIFEQEFGIKLCPNTRLKTVKFESLNSVKRFGLMIKVLSMIYRLVKTGRYSTKRDIYYQDPDLFGNQRNLDHIVENISCMLHVPRWDLHILATSKGCVAGDLVFQDVDDNFIDCRNTQMGIQVPNHVHGMHDISTNAAFILVIEKDATFQKLLEARLHEKLHPCIVITGKGFPDMNTRLLLRKLRDQFSIPVLVLVDADPHGIEIMAIYKYGSRALSFETDSLAVPSLKWLGLLPSDVSRLGIPQQARVPLSKGDICKARELLTRPYMKCFPLWRIEIETILRTKEKAEIQALDAISDTFLSDVYIPSKLRCSGWI